jgi:hypothetical protein
MMFDQAAFAIKGAADGFKIAPPFETHDLATRIKTFIDAGGVVNVCIPCLILRKI